MSQFNTVARLNEGREVVELRLQRFFNAYHFLGRCPRLALEAAPLALNTDASLMEAIFT